MRTWMALGGLTQLTAAAPAQSPPTGGTHPGLTGERLRRMTEAELVEVYRAGVPAAPPVGYSPGTIIFRLGSLATGPVARLLKVTAWQGKYLTADGRMVNRMFGVPAIAAKVATGESFIDGRPAVTFDYRGTSVLWGRYRDEVREVAPGVYLGVMHRLGRRGPAVATWFAVDLAHAGGRRPSGGR